MSRRPRSSENYWESLQDFSEKAYLPRPAEHGLAELCAVQWNISEETETKYHLNEFKFEVRPQSGLLGVNRTRACQRRDNIPWRRAHKLFVCPCSLLSKLIFLHHVMCKFCSVLRAGHLWFRQAQRGKLFIKTVKKLFDSHLGQFYSP